MRFELAVFLALLSCGDVVVTDPPTASSGGDEGLSPVTLDILSADLTACRCHHACGPGIDGVVTVRLSNPSAESVTATITDVRLNFVPDLVSEPLTVPGHGRARDYPIVLVPGSTTTVDLNVYIDLPNRDAA